jgi:hypothetical protein
MPAHEFYGNVDERSRKCPPPESVCLTRNSPTTMLGQDHDGREFLRNSVVVRCAMAECRDSYPQG